MKLQLKQRVNDLGRPGDIVDVAEAYARNFLIPRGLAVLATPAVVSEHARLHAQRQKQAADQAATVRALATKLQALTLQLSGPASPNGKLFAALKTDDVRRALHDQAQLKLPEFRMTPDHLKQTGDHQVVIRLAGADPLTINVHVQAIT